MVVDVWLYQRSPYSNYVIYAFDLDCVIRQLPVTETRHLDRDHSVRRQEPETARAVDRRPSL